MKAKPARLSSEFGLLVRALMSEELGRKVSSAEASAAINAYRKALKTCVRADGRVVVPGLGTFRKATRKARFITTPPGTVSAGSRMRLPAMPEIRFRPSKSWKESLR